MTEDNTQCSALKQSPMSTVDATGDDVKGGPSSQIETPGDSLKDRDHKPTTAVPLSKLCSKCRNIFDHWDQIPHTELKQISAVGYHEASSGSSSRKIENATFSHHNSLLELECSAKEGCTLCRQFVKDKRILEACRKRLQELSRRVPNGNFVGQVEVGLCEAGAADPLVDRTSCWGLAWDLVPSRFESDGPSFPLSYNSRYSTYSEFLEVYIIPTPEPNTSLGLNSQSSRSELDLPNRWLKDCLRLHQRGCGRSAIQLLPTRLVSLVNDYPQLILSTQLSPNARCQYATLSHCWGQSRYSVLERETMQKFMERIPSTALSKTFLDAMDIAQKLGIQYIWIDSLCIIQDDRNDWEKESSLMSSVYGGSAVNIAASGAEDGSIGCFFERDFSSRCLIQISSLGEEQLYECFPYDIYGIEVTRMPLMSRGWALQERVLPTRTLHFTKTQMYWECYELHANEIFPSGIPSLCIGTYFTSFTKDPVALQMWPGIVQHYSRCKLTFNEDKLPALSGLARELHVQTNDQYLAGLWRHDIESQLCWKTVGLGNRYETRVAPTWSWAAIEAEVSFLGFSRNSHCLAHVTRADIPLSDSTLFGKIPNGKGRLHINCTYLLHADISSTEFLGTSTWSFHFEEEDAFSRGHLAPFYIWIDNHEAPMGGPFYFLPLAYDGPSESANVKNLFGLFIQPTKSKRGEYERVGMFFLNWSTNRMFEILDKMANNPLFYTGPEDFDEIQTDADGKVNRIITLV